MAVRNSVSIDAGGTFTDCVLWWDGQVARGKSDTTLYDMGVGFMRALGEAAGSLGVPVDEVVKHLDTVRYSTTVAMNSLIQRTGPKLGVIITRGFEDTLLIGRARSWGDGLGLDEIRNLAKVNRPEPLVPQDLIVGVNERVDCSGNVLIPLNREEVLEKLRYLTDKGVRGIAVCLLWSFMNPVHERMVYDIIKEEYPDIFLGNVPVVLSSEVAPVKSEYLRLVTTVLDAYMHLEVGDQIHRIGGSLRDRGYKKSIFIAHNTGGLGKFSRTPAVNIYGSGPVAGLHGALYLSQIYGIPNLIATDMGGTSFDFGLVTQGAIRHYFLYAVIERFRTSLPMIEMSTIGAGGGSIAWIHPTLGRLMVGPRSAGALPGAACYDMGGTEPTVTDADVVLGYMDPEYFLGGRRILNKDLAVEAIREKIADPLGMSVTEAAYAIKQVIDAKMADLIDAEVSLKGYDARDFAVVAYGGAGATHCCGYSGRLESPRVIIPAHSAVFCAMGLSQMAGVHVYERSRYVTLQRYMSPEYLSDYDEFNSPVQELHDMAVRDMTREGYKADELEFALELEMKWGGTQLHTLNVRSPTLFIKSDKDIVSIIDSFEAAYAEFYGAPAVFREAGSEVITFRLKAMSAPEELTLPAFRSVGKSPKSALKGKRQAYWGELGGFVDTKVYQYELLKCANVVRGPAIIESVDTTYVVPAGWKLTIDKYLNAVVEKI